MPLFPADVLTDFARDLFLAAGVPRPDAERTAVSLVDGNLCGHDSHGLIRVPQYIAHLRAGKMKANVPLTVLNETPALLGADAEWGLGQVQAHRLLDRILPKAKAIGVAVGTLRRCGHIGRLGEYAERVAAEGMALFAAVNSHGSGRRVAPPGGRAGRISTNPLCLAAPTPTAPLVLDIGTSVAAEGKVRVAFQSGKPVPEGWLIDSDGRPTTNPAALYADPPGAILPFGGSQSYKGFGLGLMVDVLTGGLSGGQCSRPDAPMPGLGNSVLMILLSIDHLGGREHFLKESGNLSEFIRNTPRVEGVEAILLPGDPERRTKEHRLRAGIEIPEGTWELLTKSAAELNVAIPVEQSRGTL